MNLSGITIHKLRLFQLVFEKGSFNQAASALNMSQSAVSQHIKSLEAAVGAALFRRSAQGVQSTPAGQLLYKRVVELAGLIRQIEIDFTQLKIGSPQSLTLGATPGAGAYILPVWLGKFRQQHPDVAVATRTELTQAMVQSVIDQRVDFSFTVGSIDDLNEPQLAQKVLSHIDYRVVIPPTHPWANAKTITRAALCSEPFLTRQKQSRSRVWLESVLDNLKISAEMDSQLTIKQAVLNGVGISILPTYTIEREVASGALVALDVKNVALTRPLLLLWRRDRAFNTVQTAFWQLLMADDQAA